MVTTKQARPSMDLSRKRIELQDRKRKAESRGLRRPESLGVYDPRDLDLSTHIAFISTLNNAMVGFEAINLDIRSVRDTGMNLEKKISMLDPSSVPFSKFKKALESVDEMSAKITSIQEDIMALIDRVDEIDETLEEL